jgi:hypothetical protein
MTQLQAWLGQKMFTHPSNQIVELRSILLYLVYSLLLVHEFEIQHGR